MFYFKNNYNVLWHVIELHKMCNEIQKEWRLSYVLGSLERTTKAKSYKGWRFKGGIFLEKVAIPRVWNGQGIACSYLPLKKKGWKITGRVLKMQFLWVTAENFYLQCVDCTKFRMMVDCKPHYNAWGRHVNVGLWEVCVGKGYIIG